MCGSHVKRGNFTVDVVSKSFPMDTVRGCFRHVNVRKESERLFIQMSKNVSYRFKVNEFTDFDNQ